MSFETSIKGNTWTHSRSRLGGRKELVKKGVYVIDHRPTGRFLIGSSDDVSKEVDKQLAQLEAGSHPIKLMQRLFDTADDDKGNRPPMVITEIPIVSKKDIMMTLHQIRDTNTTPYCLLN